MSMQQMRDQYSKAMRHDSQHKQLSLKRIKKIHETLCQDAIEEVHNYNPIESDSLDDELMYNYGPTDKEIGYLLEDQLDYMMEESMDGYHEKKTVKEAVRESKKRSNTKNIGFGNFSKKKNTGFFGNL